MVEHKKAKGGKHKARIPFWCRIGHHTWDCNNSRKCIGDHHCIYCPAVGEPNG